ncbi:unnamed protein product [Closterium sp. NIES-54]
MVGEDEESDYDECAFAFFSPVEMPGEPATLKEALESSDAEEWKKAMESELKSIEENGTWELVELPEGRKAITSKWLFKIKSDADGKIERYKFRLVAKGYQQKEKVDYKELFALVVKPTTLRTLVAGAAIKGLVVKQMDVTTAFLNGVLEEEIFLAQPEGLDDGSGRVLRLKKALYGLKQAPRQWYLKLRGVLEEIGFTPSSADHSLFMLGEGEQRSFMVVYVDDILIFSPSYDLVKEVMLKLQDKFKCKALGDINFYYGLHIKRDVEKRCMRVHQRKYLEALAANFGQSEGHVATPFPSGSTGMWVAKYLGQTLTIGLQYSAVAQRRQKGADGVEPGRLFLTAFSDASYASEPKDMTSVGGFICCVGGGPTAWESKKQVDQALSSVESEYMALFLEDLVSHLPTSNARYRATVPAEDHYLSLDPTTLTVDLLEKHLLAAETSTIAVGAARVTLRPPFFEGCSPSPLAPSYASAGAADVSVAEDVGAAFASAKRRSSKGKGGGGGSGSGGSGSGSSGGGSSGGGGGGGTRGGSGGSGGGGGGSGGSGSSGGSWTGGGGTGARRVGSGGGQLICTGDRAGQTCGRLHTQNRYFSRLDDAWRAKSSDDIELTRWADLLRYRIAIFDLDFDAILYAMYALSVSAEGDCYWCVPLDPGIAAAALGASDTTLTPLSTAVPVRLADPSGGPVVARSSTVLPCPAIPSGSLSGLHLPSFSANLVSTTALQDAMVTATTPGGQRVTICTCTRTGRHLATFTCWPGSSLYTLATEPPQVATSAQVSASGQVAASCLCRLLSHQTLLWHHRLGHPSLPRLHGMHSRLLVSDLPRSLPPLAPSPAPPCLPCVEGRQRAAPHSSSFPSTSAPLQTLHMDRFGQDLPILHLHSDRGGEFSSNLLREFCCGEGILQSFTLPESPQQNGIAERRIGLVMEPRVSLPETSRTLRWTGEVGDALVFRVWGSRAFVRDTSVDKLSPRAIPYLFLGFVPDGPAPSGVSQVDPRPSPAPVQVALGLGAARGAGSGGAEPGGEEPVGAEPVGEEHEGAEPGVPESEGAESGGAEPRVAASSGDTGAGGAGVIAVAGGAGGTTATGPGGARTRGTGAAGTGGIGGAGAGDPTEPGAPGAVDPGAGGAGDTVRARLYFVALLQQVLGVLSSPSLTPPLLCPAPDQSQLPL